MNKKFSTLMAASLVLAGSLWSGDASAATVKVTSLADLQAITNWEKIKSQGETGTGVWTLLEEIPEGLAESIEVKQDNEKDTSIDKVIFAMSGDQTLTAYQVAKGGNGGVANLANYLRINHPVTFVADKSNGKITGMGLEINSDGVTIDGLTLEVKSCNNQPTATKSAIVLGADVTEATITNNTITDATKQTGLMSYGIVVKGNDTEKLKIENNDLKITAVANDPNGQTWVPSALSFTGLEGDDDSAAKIAAKNVFDDCVMDYADSRKTSAGKSYYYDAQVTLGENTAENAFAQAVAELASGYKSGYTSNLTVNGADIKDVVAAITKAGEAGVTTVEFPDDFALAVGGVNLVVGDASLDNENKDLVIDLDGSLVATKWDADGLNAMLGNGFMLDLVANDHAITKGDIFDGKLLTLTEDGYLKVDGKYLTIDGTWRIDGTLYDKLATTDKKDNAEKVEVWGIPSSKVIFYVKVGNQYLSAVATKDGNAIDEQYLTLVSNKDDANLSYVFASDTRVNVYDEKNNPFLDRYVTMTFVTNDKKLKAKNGKVLGLDNDGASAELVEAARYLQAKPEGQWVVSLPKATTETEFIFINRENEEVDFDVLYMNVIDAAKNMYAVTYKTASTFSYGERDTFIINAVDPKLTVADFYVNYKETEIKDTQYKLAVASTEETDFYVTENHAGKHLLGLTKEKNDGANWKVVATGDTAIVVNASYEYSKKKKGFVSVTDTLFIPTYAFQNAGNREFLTYDDMDGSLSLDEDAMICDKNVKDLEDAKDIANYAFVLKKKADGLFNIIGIEGRVWVDEKDHKKGYAYYGLDLTKKLFGATTTKQGQVQVEATWEQINSNDLFKIVNLDAPEYHKVANGFGEVVSIFRADNESQVLYEKQDKDATNILKDSASFLNIDNVNQYGKINPALFVDTAYINRGTKENPNTCWQYLLAVNADVHDPDTCTVPGHPKTDRMVTARYLINVIDSANVYGASHLHNNPYINEGEAGENLAKLAFVDGIHINDTLYIIRNNGDSVKLELDTPDFNIAKFAFRYVNPANENDKTFKIQTQIKNYKEGDLETDDEVSNEGYLKWINGTVVVVPTFERGDVFGINEDETRTPTANDEISASEVSVVAINGAVIVKGAEGKNVVITNVLGQQIANTVVSSSEATIAAPAGIVVVAVEGEAAVKAIVK